MKKHFILVALLALALLLPAAPALAQTPVAPEGALLLATNAPSIVADKGKALTFTIDILNGTKDLQQLDLKADGPADWNPTFRQSGTVVRSVMVRPNSVLSVDFQVKSPATAATQEYTFNVQAVSKAGASASLRLVVALQDKPAVAGLSATTQYPESRGQAGSTYSYRITIKNDADADRTVAFAADLPAGWDATFKAGYENRQVTSFPIKANSESDVTMDITTPSKADAGDYNVIFRAAADNEEVKLPLKITLIGNYKVSLTTASGQLSTKATTDQETKLTLVVRNTGTAPLTGVSLSSSHPDGWDITFSQDKIDTIPVGESVQVNAILKPSSKVLAGDYMVTMSAYTGQTTDSKDIRVTVETPTSWGIAAIVAIVIVLGALALIFARFSRR
jgi:uncharacterized repeat protein (TIGR01451 family)